MSQALSTYNRRGSKRVRMQRPDCNSRTRAGRRSSSSSTGLAETPVAGRVLRRWSVAELVARAAARTPAPSAL